MRTVTEHCSLFRLVDGTKAMEQLTLRARAFLHGIVKILLSCLSMENIIFTRSEDK